MRLTQFGYTTMPSKGVVRKVKQLQDQFPSQNCQAGLKIWQLGYDGKVFDIMPSGEEGRYMIVEDLGKSTDGKPINKVSHEETEAEASLVKLLTDNPEMDFQA